MEAAAAQSRPLPREGLLHEDPRRTTGQGEGQIPQLIADAVAHGYKGFCTLEPHLVVAEKFYGFTGPERFSDAALALKTELSARDVSFA